MEWVETTGRTVTEALEAALDQLGVDEHDAEVVVVEQPKAGLFGLRRAPARVRARVRPTSPRPKRQQRDRRGRSTGAGSGDSSWRDRPRRDEADGGPGAGSLVVESDARPPADEAGDSRSPRGGSRTNGGGDRGRRRGGRGGSSQDLGTSHDAGSATASSAAEDASDGQTARRPRRRRSGGGSSDGETRDGETRDGSTSPQRARPTRRPDKPDTEEMQMSIEEQAALAQTFVAGVVERLGMTAATLVATSEELETIEVSVEGEGLGLLIGPHGATLGALQELTRTVVQRHTSEHSARVIVDVAGYRAKRAEALALFARRVVEEVLTTGTAHSLEPMSASDRKVVHDTVNELAGVETSSEGEGDNRHVVIRPTRSQSRTAEVVEEADDGPVDGAEDPLTRVEEEADAGEGDAENGEDDGYQAEAESEEVTDAR